MSAYQTNLGWGVENYKSMDGMVSGWEKKTLDPDKKISNEVYVAKILNYWKSYSKAYTAESDPDNYELISKMHTDIEKDCQNYNVGYYAAFYKNQIEVFVNDDAKAVYDCLSALHSKLTDVGGYLDDAIEALDDAEEEEQEQELEALKNQWVSDAEKLPDGQVKQNMVNEASTRTEKLDHEKLEALQQVLGNMKDSYETCLSQLESEKFNSKVLYNYSGSDFFNNYVGTASWDGSGSLSDAASALKSSKLQYTPTSYRNMDSTLVTDNEFYKYMDSICKKSDDTDDTEKDAAESTKGDIEDKNDLDGEASVDDLESKCDYPSMEGGSGLEGESKVDTGGDDKDVTASAGEVSGSIADQMDGLEKFFTNARNDVLLEEYITEMFSCYVSGKEDFPTTSLSGNGFNDGQLIDSVNYRSEVEYLIFGNSDPQANVTTARNYIFAIRFALNLIYAFTGDPMIKTETLALATAIAGWTGFGVPIVQNVLIIALAAAESVWDTTELMSGKDVVIYKTQQTWRFKLSGKTLSDIGDSITDYAAERVESWIDDVAAGATDKIEDFTSNVDDMIDQKTESVVNGAINTVLNPLENICLSIVPDVGISDEEIVQKVDEAFATIESNCVTGDGITQFATKTAFDYVKSNYRDALISNLKAARDESIGGESTHVSIEEIFDDIQRSLSSELKELVQNSSFMQEFKESMSDMSGKLVSAVEDANGKLDSSVESIRDEMKNKIAGFTTETDEIVGGIRDKDVDTSTGVMLTMNYKEYLKLFTIIGFVAGNEDAMLSRVGALVELNTQESVNSDFSLDKSYTMVQISGDVSVETSFLKNIDSYLATSNIQNDKKADMSFINNGSYTFTYNSVLGY